MEYTWYELVLFFFIYSFMGWIFEVLWVSIRTGYFCNRGILSGPWCPAYGISMNIIIISVNSLNGRYAWQYVLCIIVTSVLAYVSGLLTEKITDKKLWNYEDKYIFQGSMGGIMLSLVLGTAAMICVCIIHPVVFMVADIMPDFAVCIIAIILLVIIVFDIMSLLYAEKHHRDVPAGFSEELGSRKKTLGGKIYDRIDRRIERAYPGIINGDVRAEGNYVFAEGMCADKFIWIFIMWAFLGDIIETFYVGLTAGKWMSRSSLIYGTFSIVWGLGAALATVFLHKLIGKDDRYIFIGGFFLGGAYEYLCSVFTEVFFGTTFWDYSNMPFNIGGRTNLLFCLFWGIIAIVWLKLLYPPCSRLIGKVPVVAGKIITWVAVILLSCDMLISAAAMVRYVERTQGIEPVGKMEEFVDFHYPDELVEFVWPNMRIQTEK